MRKIMTSIKQEDILYSRNKRIGNILDVTKKDVKIDVKKR
jgi:hypothetical protein